LFLDPPSLIFILRLHLMSVARRKVAAAGGAAGSDGQGAGGSSQQAARIPPPVQLPAWAHQQLQQQQLAGGSWQPPSTSGRHISDAPDALCCPITGQVRGHEQLRHAAGNTGRNSCRWPQPGQARGFVPVPSQGVLLGIKISSMRVASGAKYYSSP